MAALIRTMMRSKSRQLISVVVASLCCLAAQAQESAPGADVGSLLALAKEHNPEIAGSRYEAEAAAERIGSAGALPDPKLRTEWMDITRNGTQGATLVPSRVGSMRYTLMQDIPWFGKRDLKREIAELEAESARNRALGTWSDVSAKIKTTHAQLYYLVRNVRLTREILDLLVRLEQIARVRYSGGLAAQQDVIRAQTEQTALRNELVALESEQRQAQARMNALLARPAGAPLAEAEKLRSLPPPARLDHGTLEALARSHNPLLAAEASRLQSAEKSRDLAYRNRYPDFTVGIVPNQFQNSFKEWNVMVEMNLPLQQSSRRAQEREAEATVAAAHARKEAAANQVQADLMTNLAGLDAARRSEMLASDDLLPQAELTFKSALAGYENGKVDFTTLLDAQRQIRLAKQTRIKAQAESQARLAEIERIVGEEL